MANTKKIEPKNKIGEIKVGTILYANTGVPVKVLEYDKKFGGRVLVERADGIKAMVGDKEAKPLWRPVNKFSLEKPKLKVGGGVGKFFSKAKSYAKEGFDKTKKYTKDKIHDQKKKVALEVIDDTKDKVSSPKDKIALKGAEEMVAKKYKKGGKVKAKKLLKPRKPNTKDLARKSKHTGYRFKTDHLKNKDGKESKLAKKLHYKRPTIAEIEKYKKNPDGSYPNKVKEVYHERRQDRTHSDDKPSKKFDEGGKVTKVNEREGWLTIVQCEEKLGRKLHWWKDDMFSLNGKVYEKCYMLPFYKPVKTECDVKDETKIEATPAPIIESAPAPIVTSTPEPTPPPILVSSDNNLGAPTV